VEQRREETAYEKIEKEQTKRDRSQKVKSLRIAFNNDLEKKRKKIAKAAKKKVF